MNVKRCYFATTEYCPLKLKCSHRESKIKVLKKARGRWARKNVSKDILKSKSAARFDSIDFAMRGGKINLILNNVIFEFSFIFKIIFSVSL